jgi:hyperosmotically inducible periplasmic protein
VKQLTLASISALPLLLMAGPTFGQTPTLVAPDNSKSNDTVKAERQATSDMQKNDASDIDLVKRIRQSVMADNTLSTYGHNVKIVAVNGTVTLNGVVRSDAEKQQIGKKAASIAGEGRVIDDLKVASPK